MFVWEWLIRERQKKERKRKRERKKKRKKERKKGKKDPAFVFSSDWTEHKMNLQCHSDM